jgi:autotransporter-associated beta strand protein
MKPKLRLGKTAFVKLIAISFCPVLAVTAHAATVTWNGAVNGVWDTATANWTGTTFTSGDDAVFSGTPINNVTAAAGLTIGTITLNSGFTGSVALTGNNTVNGATAISGGALLVTQPGAAVGTVAATNLGTSAVTINSGGQLYLDDEGNGTAGNERILALGNTIAGAGTLQARASSVMTNGWSSVNLTGDLSGFTGTFNILAGSTINRGKVKFTAASQAAVLASSATVNVANGAQLYLNQAYNYGFGIHLNGGTGGENNGSLRLDNATLDVTGGVTLHADSIVSGAGKISGAIGQSGGTYRLTKVGNNTTVLNGPNTYGGGTTISAGTVSVGNNTALGSGAVTMAGGALNVSTAAGVALANDFILNNGTTFTASTGALTLNGNVSGSPTGNWNLTATNKLTLAGTNSPTISGNFAGLNIAAGAGGIDITGSTIINGNVANQQSGYMNVAGASTITVKSGGGLTINGTAHASFPTSIVGQNAAGTSSVIVDGGSFTIGGNTAFAFGNNIAAAVGVLTVTSGTATINAGSTTATDGRSFIMLGKDAATGTINLNGGTLASGRNFVRDGAGTVSAGAANFIFGGGTLKALASQPDWLNSADINSNQLALTSVTTTAPSTIDSNGFAVGINNAISGSGGFTITDSSVGATGVVTLGGIITYAGTTSVTGGTLAITGSVAGLVSVSTAGSLAVGEASPSTNMAVMSLGTLSLATGGSIRFDVTSSSSYDQLTVTTASGLSISGGGIGLYDAGTTNALIQTGTYTLINYSGTLTGSVSGLTVTNPRVGYAYVFANTGSAITVTVSLTNDTDGDGMPDVYEDANGLNKLVNDANGNPDGDFSTNHEEYLAGTNPQSPGSDANNTDNDGLRDSWEITWFTNITAETGSGDPDGDYATNLQEQTADTDPTYRLSAPDGDGDSMGDAWELHFFPNLTVAHLTSDNDTDGFLDSDEFTANTDPTNILQTPDDTDADGLADAWEFTYFFNLDQLGTADSDGDYATHEQEETASTDPSVRTNAPDGDGDGIGDAWEIHHFTNTTTATLTSDSDIDTVTDLDEFLNNTDPKNATDPYSGTAVMTWATPATVTADTDILSSGTLLHAGNFRSDNINVSVTAGSGTIDFKNRQSQDAAGVLLAGEEARVIAGSGGRQVNAALFDATGTTVGAAFESVLDGSAWENTDPGPAPGLTDMVLRVTGVNGAALVTGQQYQIQLFYSDDRAGNNTRGQIFHDDAISGNASDPILAGDSKAVVGTFTASAAGYQDIHIRNTSGEGNFPVGINAYVLRTAAAANDYASWAATNAPGQTTNQDHDNDGVKNGLEYFMGATGSTFTANPGLVAGSITWPKNAAFVGSYLIQTSPNLSTWTTAVSGVTDNGTSVVYTPTPGLGKLFVRLIAMPN